MAECTLDARLLDENMARRVREWLLNYAAMIEAAGDLDKAKQQKSIDLADPEVVELASELIPVDRGGTHACDNAQTVWTIIVTRSIAHRGYCSLADVRADWN